MKEKWIAALRSGAYKQGKHLLRSWNNQFCCLGVAIDVVEPDKWELQDNCYINRNNSNRNSEGHLTTNGVSLNDYFCKLFGLTYSQQTTLQMMNDEGKYFEEIADYIEENIC